MSIFKSKKIIAVFLSLILILTLYFPISSFAAPGTLGSEKPHLYCSFANSEDGGEADGNNLTAGTYDVSFFLSGMQSFALLDIMGIYDTSIMTVNSYSELLSDAEGSQFKSPGVFMENGNFDLVLTSTNDDCSAVNSDGQLLIKINVTISSASAVDFADVLTLNTHPQETFIEADFTDYPDYSAPDHDCYALVTEAEDYKGTLFPMTADLSPSSGYTVSGTVLALANVDGSLADESYSVRECDVIIDGEVVATTDDNGNFVIENLPSGDYDVTLSYIYGYDRIIHLTVENSNVNLGNVGMVVCNFSNDQFINYMDFDVYLVASGSKEGNTTYNKYCDFNHDGLVNFVDYTLYANFSGKTLNDSIYS